VQPDITLISPYPRLGARHDGDSGVASYTANLVNALAARGEKICVIAPETDGQPRFGNDGAVEVRRVFRQGIPSAVPSALAPARDTGAPVIHLQHELFLYSGATGLATSVVALRTPRRQVRLPSSRQRTIITMHQVVDPATVTRNYTRMHRVRVPAVAARPAIAAVHRILPALADLVLVRKPAFRRIIPGTVVVPHSIEVPVSTHEPRAEVRRRLGLPQDRLLALCFGFLAPYKGPEAALGAAESVGDSAHLVVAGGPHPRLAAQGDDYAQRLRARWGASARFTGYVPDAAIGDWFRAADLSLLCYPEPHASSGPLALALAHRTPVLLSARLAETVGADPDLAVAGGTQDWATRLRCLADDPAQLARLRRQVDIMARDGSWQSVASRQLQLYRQGDSR
jgi:glycosyltransferase involved in cell wall biosynthesis